MALSLRLQSLLDRCLPELPVWDLCCDHGLLGLEALVRGHAEVVFNDAVPHVLNALTTRLSSYPNARVICALAENIANDIAGNVVLAGIGGEKIYKILSAHNAAGRLSARRLLLCPEKDALWLREQTLPGYKLSEAFEIPHGQGSRWIYRMDACSHE